MVLLDDILLQIYIKGKYYQPACAHYGKCSKEHHDNGLCMKQVMCDNCDKHIRVSIGYGKYDICLDCMSKFDKDKHTDTNT
jgi:NADH:ubiquinone oxidoreductase subunit F (NADH-binding)